MHGEPEQRGENADFDHDPQNRGRGCFDYRWMFIRAAGIETHHAGGVGNCFYTREREHDSDKAGPVLPETAVQRLQMSDRFVHVRQTEKSERHNDERGWNRKSRTQDRQCFWSEKISGPMTRIAAAANFSGCGTPR